MKKDLIKSFLIYGLGDALSKLVPFILLPFFTEVLLPAEYGVLEIINTIILILAVFGRVQLDTSLQRFFYEENENRSKLISTIFWSIFCLSSVLMILALLFSSHLSVILFSTIEYSYLIKIASIVFLLINVNSYFSIICRYLNMPMHFSIITFSGVLLNGFISFYLVYILKINIVGILYGQIVGLGLTSCLFIFLCRKYICFSISKLMLNKTVTFALPSLPAAVLSVFNMHINKFIMLYFLTEASLGVYSIALNLGSGVNIIVSAFALVWFPFMYKNYDSIEGKNLIYNIYNYACGVIMVLLVILSCFVEDLLPFLIRNTEYHISFYLVSAIALCFFYRVLKHILDSSILIQKKTKYITYQFIATLTVNIILLLLLINKLQLVGVVISLVSATITSILLSFYFTKKINLLVFNSGILYATLVYSVLIVFLNLFYDFNIVTRILFILASILISVFYLKKLKTT